MVQLQQFLTRFRRLDQEKSRFNTWRVIWRILKLSTGI